MAVFVAAADESDGPFQKGPFVYGGFVGPARFWIDVFAPAWQERVLNGKPVLPYFHMAEIRNPRWQAKVGIPDWEAERRIDEAVRVIASSGSIHLVRTSMDGGYFREVFGKTSVLKQSGQPGKYPFVPDFIGFLGFARGVLEYVHRFHPEAHRVDFVAEKKERVSHHLPTYYDQLVKWIRENDAKLLDLIGDLTPTGDKSRVPLQAADLAMWHVRRHEAGESEARDWSRLRKMFDERTMTLTGLTNDEISHLGERSKLLRPADPFAAKKRG